MEGKRIQNVLFAGITAAAATFLSDLLLLKTYVIALNPFCLKKNISGVQALWEGNKTPGFFIYCYYCIDLLTGEQSVVFTCFFFLG